MFHESLLILLQSSLPNIMGFARASRMHYLHLHSNWEMVNKHLGKCADERDIQALENFARSPMFLSLVYLSQNQHATN